MKTLQVGSSEFTRTKFSGIDGKTAVAWAEPHGFKLEARPHGMVITGSFEISDLVELEAFARLVTAAWTDRESLKPKLVSALSGH